MIIVVLAGCKDDERVETGIIYFLVEELTEEHGDSYVLQLSDPAHIAEARAIIAGTSDPKIVLAEIAEERAGTYNNKDLNTNSDWSWYCDEFLGFYDNTIEIYDGWPGYVEENYDEWVENTRGNGENGVIGFWNYTVTREVEPWELE